MDANTNPDLTREQTVLIAHELFKSIEKARKTKAEAKAMGEEEFEDNPEAASISEMEEYIEDRKQVLDELGMPYNDLLEMEAIISSGMVESDDDGQVPSSETVSNQFGSWEEAIQEAGLEKDSN